MRRLSLFVHEQEQSNSHNNSNDQKEREREKGKEKVLILPILLVSRSKSGAEYFPSFAFGPISSIESFATIARERERERANGANGAK